MNSKNETKNKEYLIFSFLNGELSVNEKKELEDWIKANPSNQEVFHQFYLIWKTNSINSGDEYNDIENTYHKLLLTRDIKTFKEERTVPKRKQIHLSFSKAAAILILILGLSFFLNYSYFKSKSTTLASIKNVIEVPRGAKTKISLPDGTKVWLNAGSTLSYSANFGNGSRDVYLIGEGYFKVVKREKMTFTVHTSKMNVTALGTEFNVKAYPEEKTIEAILVKGKILVNQSNKEGASFTEGKKNILSHPGEKLKIYTTVIPDSENITAKSDETTNVVPSPETLEQSNVGYQKALIETSWKDDLWRIEKEDLQSLAAKLERRYDIEIFIDTEELKNYRFSGILKNESLEQVLKVIRLSAPIQFKVIGKKVYLSSDTKLKNSDNAYY